MKAAFSLFFCVLLCYGQVALALAEAAAGPKRGKAVRVLRIAKGEVFVLKADMYIAKRMTLETDSKLLCAPNTRVILLTGAELLVAAGVQIGCKPGTLGTWKGIRCEGQNKVTISGEANHEVQIADAEVGIEVQKASSLTISYAKFTGLVVANATQFSELVGTGIQINGPATISNCTFTGLKRAIEVKDVSAAAPPLSISANGFYGNETAIAVALPATKSTSLDLSCNVFEPGDWDGSTTPPTITRSRRGNAWGIKVVTGALGNVGVAPTTVSGSYTFAANVWPANSRANVPTASQFETDPSVLETGTLAWSSPTGWTSIAGSGGTDYYKFQNEFLGIHSGLNRVRWPTINQPRFVKEFDQVIPPSLTNDFVVRCDNGLPGDPFVIPTSRPSDGYPSARIGGGLASYLLQNIPNPAAKETLIGYHIDGKYQTAAIEIIELATGKTKQILPLQPTSAKALILPLNNYATGLYGYKLMVDGKVLDVKKMLVQP